MLPVLLTDLLTTALDDRGRDRTEESGERGRSDPLDGTWRTFTPEGPRPLVGWHPLAWADSDRRYPSLKGW